MDIRLLKYRAWCKPIKQMCRVVRIDFINFVVSVIVDEERRANRVTFTFDQIYLMSFSGTYDKRGKKLFEYDVCYDSDDETRAIVRWSSIHHGFRLFEILPTGRPISDTKRLISQEKNIDWLELLGNIYENPELIGD